ncbi:hypothetical protein, partial [Nocardia gipuzkoensis]|uniref:hypothetical protein n=1 Tax=Nocardia gipuzkoensis TaxID=2749991 RepID=UPI0015EED6F0
ITKVQEKGLGNELARADMKDARDGNRTPFAILADFGNTGLADGDREAGLSGEVLGLLRNSAGEFRAAERRAEAREALFVLG